MKYRLALLCLLFAGPLWGQSLTLPKEVSANVGEWVIVPVTSKDGGTVQWYAPDPGLTEIPLASLFGPKWAEETNGRVFKASANGRYRVCAYCAKGDHASPIAVCTVVIGQSPEPPPVPPGPPPKPPDPPPGPVPIPGEGLRVLIVYESADLAKLPKDQLNAMQSQKVLNYLDTHCAKGPDGKTPEWRIWDQNVPTGGDAKVWRDAMARKRDKLPWLIVSNGKTGYEGPLPPNTDAMLRTLQTYGGQ